MNILLAGGSSRIMDAMINKLNKGGHKVYLLTGQKGKKGSYKWALERYNFLYDDDNVIHIIESVKPDIILFMGAYDTNFNWTKGRQESVRYASGLINLLSVCSLMENGRFVYLSSQEVYGGSYGSHVREEETVSPKSYKAMAIAQGEEICRNYSKLQGIHTVILRPERIYHIPQKGQEEDNPCFRMCLEAVREGKIYANKRHVFSMIYLNDAIELIYKVMIEKEIKHSCYNLSSMEEINELQLAEIIKKEMGPGVSIVDNTVGESRRLILNGNRYREEFGQKIFVHYQEGVKKTAQFIKKNKESFITAGDAGGGWIGRVWHSMEVMLKTAVPYIENLICFFLFFMLNNQTAGSRYFERLDFYLLYVLLFATVHGQQQAVFSALLAVTGYCFHQMYGRSGFEVLLDYNTYVWMAQLFIVGMVVGYMRDRLYQVRAEKDEEIRYVNEKLEGIADINDSNVRMKHGFEAQLVNQRDSLGKIYEITSSLERYEPEEMLFYAAQVLGMLMDSRDVAIYTVANKDYARLFSSTSAEARKLGSSIKYTDMTELYGELREKRVFINKTLAENLPLMACAVYAEEEMQLILMIWGIPWQRMTLAEANRLTIIGTLIQNASVRANRYMESLRSQRYVGDTQVLKEEAFARLVKVFFEARDKGLTECSLLEIVTEDKMYEQAIPVLGKCIRQTDYMGMPGDGKLYILLSNTDKENARSVIERFQNAGYKSLLKEEMV